MLAIVGWSFCIIIVSIITVIWLALSIMWLGEYNIKGIANAVRQQLVIILSLCGIIFVWYKIILELFVITG
jgi:hypothetical protein